MFNFTQTAHVRHISCMHLPVTLGLRRYLQSIISNNVNVTSVDVFVQMPGIEAVLGDEAPFQLGFLGGKAEGWAG